MKKIKSILFFLTIVASACIPQQTVYANASSTIQPHLPDVIARVMPSVCRIKAWEEDYDILWEVLWQRLDEAKRQNKTLINIPSGVSGGGGSCLVQDATKGIIVTAHHITRGNKFFVMRLMGSSREYLLEEIGNDEATDIAVLRVKNLDGLPLPVSPVVFGDSDALRPGEQVFAVGYPAEMTIHGLPPRDEVGYEEYYPSVVAGVVSGRLRFVNLQQFIQIDAITDAGYSGGGVFNAKGELIATPNEGIDRGQSYAIASNQLTSVVAELERHGKIERGILGTVWGEMKSLTSLTAFNLAVTPAMRKKYPHSLVVTDIVAGSAAQDAGMKIGDIITHINGEPVRSAKLAQQYIGSKKPGTAVRFTMVRQTKNLEIMVILRASDG